MHEHTHAHNHGHHDHSHSGKGMKTAFFLNGGFAIIEFIGGIYTNSTAILSDAIHDMGDAAAIGASIYLEKVAKKGRDKKYSYGYKRYSPLAALINTIILLTGSTVVLYQAIPRLLAPEPLNTNGMLLLAVLGILFNGVAVFRLKSESSTLSKRAIMLHLMEDLLGWAAVLVGSILIKLTGWTIIDPIMSLGITIYILYNVFRNLSSIFKIFMQTAPDDVDADEIKARIMALEHVKDVHDIHVWSMDGNYHIATIHVVVSHQFTAAQQVTLKRQIVEITEALEVNHLTTEIEFENETCEKCD